MEKTGSVTKPKLKQLTSPVPPPPLPPLPDNPGTDLVAKSPPEPPKAGTLQSSSDESAPRRDADTVRVLQYAGLQMVCAVLMLVLGVLTLVHRSAMGRWGAGLWGGGAAAATGLAGLMAALRGFYHPGEQLGTTGVTVYLALCLVSLATTTLAIVITSTGLLRDLHAPVVDEDPEALTAWAPVLSSLGLLLASVLLAVSLVAASLRVYRRVCPCTRPPPHRLLESPASSLGKQGLVHSWLGLPPQASPMAPVLYPAAPQPLMVYPPPLMVEGSGLYTMPPSTIGYPQCISPLPSNPYMQRRRSPHPRGRNSVTPDSAKRSRRPEKRDREPAKEREITDEQLEKTYTGLDREIAEEFISIAMTNSGNSTRGGQRRTSRGDKVIDCIAPQ